MMTPELSRKLAVLLSKYPLQPEARMQIVDSVVATGKLPTDEQLKAASIG